MLACPDPAPHWPRLSLPHKLHASCSPLIIVFRRMNNALHYYDLVSSLDFAAINSRITCLARTCIIDQLATRPCSLQPLHS